MKEDKKFAISNTLAEAVAGEEEDLKSIILKEICSHEKDIDSLLMGYFFRKRGQVMNIKLNHEDFKLETRDSGYFKVTFEVGYSLGCSDNSYEEESEMNVKFQINSKDKVMILTGEEFPERGLDEI